MVQTKTHTGTARKPDLLSEYKGLTSAEAELSRRENGSNHFSRKKQPGFASQFLKNLNDPIIRILIGALFLNILFLFPDIDWYECGGIAFAVLISSLVSTISEYNSGKAFDGLYRKLGDISCTVLRNGSFMQMPIGDLVCMDIVRLHPGEIIPADGLLVSGAIQADEASLTGESLPAEKTACPALAEAAARQPFPRYRPEDPYAVFRGSTVCSGDGVMLVTHVGDDTVYGQVAAQLQEDDLPSPLKERLTRLARTISRIGYVSAAFVALAHLFHAFYLESGMNLHVMLTRMQDFSFVWSECLAAMTMAISILVVAVPEGLPMMITVVLSSNMQKMMKNGVLVRKLVGIETSGSLSMLFTDKTGTLTTGALSVSELCTGYGRYDSVSALSRPELDMYRQCASACSGSGNATEKAIASFLALPEPYKNPAWQTIPFDSDRKYSAACTQDCGYIRGAAEILLPYCKFWLDQNGKSIPMSYQKRSELHEILQTAAANSSRVILQGCFPVPDFPHLKNNTPECADICFTGLWILQDEIRSEAVKAVGECHAAGIQVVMITGDNEWTAAAIARRTGILSPSWKVYLPSAQPVFGEEYLLRGQDLQNLSDGQLSSLLPHVRVISRVTPTDKSRLVRAAQASGHIVGMTGDGINDTPALKAADVGYAMGSGTEAAKEAGDIVITDDNFSSICNAVLFGRTIFQSIRKFIVFQLIMNLSAVCISLLGPLVGIEHPVTVIQMLWVNIIMDTLGSLAFAGEAPLREYMHQMPVSRKEPILTGSMVQQILFSAAYGTVLCMGFLTSTYAFYRIGRGDTAYFLTVFFALFVFCGVHFAFTVRTPRINLFANLQKNRAFLLIMPAVACIQLLIIYFGGSIFRTVPLQMNTLLWCWLLSLTVIPFDMIRKKLSKRK